MKIKTYTPNEILEFLRADYRQRAVIDSAVTRNQHLSFDTTIDNWRDICDLVEVENLCEVLNHWFDINILDKEWMTVLKNGYDNTLEDLCKFIANRTIKIEVTSRKLFGKDCLTAGVFKAVVIELEKRGVDIRNICPSSNLEELSFLYFRELINVINLLNPQVLPPVEFESNETYQAGENLFILAILMTSLAYFFNHKLALIILIVLVCIGIFLMNKGAKLPPKKMQFTGIETVGDLIKKLSYDIQIC